MEKILIVLLALFLAALVTICIIYSVKLEKAHPVHIVRVNPHHPGMVDHAIIMYCIFDRLNQYSFFDYLILC